MDTPIAYYLTVQMSIPWHGNVTGLQALDKDSP